MTETAKVRKLAVALNGRGGFLIPCPHSLGGNGFLCLSNGKRYKKGVISYTGINVSTG